MQNEKHAYKFCLFIIIFLSLIKIDLYLNRKFEEFYFLLLLTLLFTFHSNREINTSFFVCVSVASQSNLSKKKIGKIFLKQKYNDIKQFYVVHIFIYRFLFKINSTYNAF